MKVTIIIKETGADRGSRVRRERPQRMEMEGGPRYGRRSGGGPRQEWGPRKGHGRRWAEERSTDRPRACGERPQRMEMEGGPRQGWGLRMGRGRRWAEERSTDRPRVLGKLIETADGRVRLVRRGEGMTGRRRDFPQSPGDHRGRMHEHGDSHGRRHHRRGRERFI